MAVSRALRVFTVGARTPLVAGLALLVAAASTDLLLPQVMRIGIDQGVQRQDLAEVGVLTAVAAALVLANWLTSLYAGRLTGLSCERMIRRLRVTTARHAFSLPLARYEGAAGNGVLSLMTADADTVAEVLRDDLVPNLAAILSFVGTLVALGVTGGRAAVVLVLGLPLLVVAATLARRRVAARYGVARDQLSSFTETLRESVSRMWTIQLYEQHQHSQRRILDPGEGYRDTRVRIQRFNAIYFPALDLVGVCAVATIVLLGAGRMSAGLLVSLILYLDKMFTLVQQCAQLYDGLGRARVSLGRLGQFLTEPSESCEQQPVVAMPTALRGAIELDGVVLRYPDRPEPALRGVSLRIAPGETVALVGPSGAGKSTLAKLLLGFYHAEAGTVTVDGVPVADHQLGRLRTLVGYVPQTPFLFRGTVRDNIRYGRPGSGADEVEAAADRIGAHQQILALPRGYDTEVGDRGEALSAGERQLVALARCALTDPDVVVLDEATSHLDPATEARYLSAARAVSRGRTSLIIAHRLTVTDLADRIVVVADGRIAEDGHHTQLLAGGGEYSRLWDSWSASAAG